MEQARTYDLVDPRQDRSLVLAVGLPIGFAALVWALGSSPSAASPHPWTDPAFSGAALGGLVAFEGFVLGHRARARASRLVACGGRLALVRGGRVVWSVAWSDLTSVSLRRYTLRYSYFDEALVLETREGECRVVPTASALYGRMPGVEDLRRRVADAGVEFRRDRRPTWITTKA